MTQEQTIPVVDMRHFTEGDDKARQAFIEKFGEALREYGFVAVEGHGVPRDLIYENYSNFQRFFELEDDVKQKYEDAETGRQRGYTSFGVEHAKDSEQPDLKEFFHLGRQFDEDHDLSDRVVSNIWPDEMPELRRKGWRYSRPWTPARCRCCARSRYTCSRTLSFCPRWPPMAPRSSA